MAMEFDLTFDAQPGEPVEIADNVRRITAPNPGPFTFRGTNTYLVGTERLVLVDPGPDDEAHLAAILDALGGAPLEAILVTHTHLDHTGLTAKLKAATGALVYAEGPHRAARTLHEGETNALDAGADRGFAPDIRVGDGETVRFGASSFTAIATPGHAANHLAFALEGTPALFSGDHVMAWSTTIVAPPDGSMADYMASLDKLMARPESLYLPGHGAPLERPLPFMRALRSHRRMREAAILERLQSGDRTIPEIVAALYATTDRRLHGAAGLSVLAHLEDLVGRGLAASDGPPLIGARFERV
ncbi:MBL fold metallo-hydrolase [Aureimonas mangrovi]|uniref:MBL fold metallo-hydrolase n=1 Tax=Aureimonas mangrovi TaxID=2758041 RepID=UPI00163D6496|nr:MBL fold metallo-hydrolase [Aureimonas mangrovi]